MFVLCTVNADISDAKVIFEENFNNLDDWQPRAATNDVAGTVSCSLPDTVCTTLPPANWSFFRGTGLWWGPNYNDTVRITSQAGRGGSGKSFIVYNEANIGASGDGWGADGQLSKYFAQDYPELYIRAWTYYQPGWQWPSIDDMIVKTLRADHYTGTGEFYTNFSGGNNAPIALYYFKYSNTYGTQFTLNTRCEPKATNYNCSPAYNPTPLTLPLKGTTYKPNEVGEPADGTWHRIDLHIKMNTYSNGAFNSDGVLESWYDGTLVQSKSDLRWLDTGSNPNWGWNAVSLGGNAYNSFSDNWVTGKNYIIGDRINFSGYVFVCTQNHTFSNSTKPSLFSTSAYWNKIEIVKDRPIEQWYAIDDVVISTTTIPQDYVIGGPKPLAAPANVLATPSTPRDTTDTTVKP